MLAQVANVFVALMALLHVYILVLEMFLWTTKRGRKAFGTTAEFAEASKVLAANQGLYNGFLAAGLIWGLNASGGRVPIQMFFLACVIVAGVFGAVTLRWTTLLLQTAPAAVALIFVWISTVTP